jgi:uncharacterized protein YegL
LFLVDISGSTGGGDRPDIDTINRCLPQLIENLRNPPQGSELAKQIEHVDVALVTYSDEPYEIFDFTLAEHLPASIHPFTPQNLTATGSALEFALSRIGDRIRYLKSIKTPIGLPHIFHITDGAPTDIKIGTQRWRDISEKLGRVHGKQVGSLESKQVAKILHFATPNGCDPDQRPMTDENGNKINGHEALALLSGPDSVFTIDYGVESFTELTSLIEAVITSVTKNFPAYESAKKLAQESHGKINSVE